jgi:hypothetical protein
MGGDPHEKKKISGNAEALFISIPILCPSRYRMNRTLLGKFKIPQPDMPRDTIR